MNKTLLRVTHLTYHEASKWMSFVQIIFVGHLIAVPLDGFAGNPARAFAPALVSHQWHDQWIFWVSA